MWWSSVNDGYEFFVCYVDIGKYWFISKRRQHGHVYTLVAFFPYKLKQPVGFYIMVAIHLDHGVYAVQ